MTAPEYNTTLSQNIYEIVLLYTMIRRPSAILLDFQTNQLFLFHEFILFFLVSISLFQVIPGWNHRYIPEVGGLFTPVAQLFDLFEKCVSAILFSWQKVGGVDLRDVFFLFRKNIRLYFIDWMICQSSCVPARLLNLDSQQPTFPKYRSFQILVAWFFSRDNVAGG